MPVNPKPDYLNKSDNRTTIQIYDLTFNKIDHESLRNKAYWTHSDCMDFLLDMKDSAAQLQNILKFRKAFIGNNTEIRNWEKKLDDIKPKSFDEAFNSSRDSILYGPSQRDRLKMDYQEHIGHELKKGMLLFDETYPKLTGFLKYLSECREFVNDFFSLVVVNSQRRALKCDPDAFIVKAKEKGFLDFDPRPKKNESRASNNANPAKTKCQEIAASVWESDPDLWIKNMIRHPQIQDVKKTNGDPYVDKTIRSWLTKIAPSKLSAHARRTKQERKHQAEICKKLGIDPEI